MEISVECQQCGARFKAKEAFAGRTGKCPKCNAAVQVPEPSVFDDLDADSTRASAAFSAHMSSDQSSETEVTANPALAMAAGLALLSVLGGRAVGTQLLINAKVDLVKEEAFSQEGSP